MKFPKIRAMLEFLKAYLMTLYEDAWKQAKQIVAKNSLLKNTKGMSRTVIEIVIALFIAGSILPSALVSIAGGNYTGVDPAVKTIVTVLMPILGVIAIALLFLSRSKGRGT